MPSGRSGGITTSGGAAAIRLAASEASSIVVALQPRGVGKDESRDGEYLTRQAQRGAVPAGIQSIPYFGRRCASIAASPIGLWKLVPRRDINRPPVATLLRGTSERDARHPASSHPMGQARISFSMEAGGRMHFTRLALAITIVAGVTIAIRAQESHASADVAKDFTHALQLAGLSTFATADPQQPGRFVATLYVPGQLLVVSALHPSVAAIDQRLNAGQFREVYLDLQGTPTAEGKFFVQDANGDGLLHALPNSGSVDIVYEDGARSLRFDGNPRGQQLTPDAYDALFKSADERYARALSALAGALERRRAS